MWECFCCEDGHCSAPLRYGHNAALCINGRVHSRPISYRDVFAVDAVSGVVLPNPLFESLSVDTSGALLWHGERGTVITSGALNSTGRTLAGVEWGSSTNASFRYGVIFDAIEARVLRFDTEAVPTGQPARKASAAVRCGVCQLTGDHRGSNERHALSLDHDKSHAYLRVGRI